MTSSLPLTSSPLTDGTVPYGEFFAQRRGSTASLGLADSEIDMDRTPRRSDFPHNVQDHYTPHFSTMASASMEAQSSVTAQSQYDLQSYIAGLNDLNISMPYDIPVASHSMSPFEELDFSEFLCPGTYC